MNFADQYILNRDGFAVLRTFFDRAELEEFSVFIEAALLRPSDSTCVRPHNSLVPLRWNDPVVGRALSSERRLQSLHGAVGGDDLKWISGYISSKEALSPPLWWHQDWWCWDHPISYQREAAQVAVLCYLTDTTTQNGALRVLPGSHVASSPIHMLLPEAHSQNAETLDSAHPALGELDEQVTLELNAGDAIVLDYRLLHGTHANATGRRRDCVLLTFTPSWGRLPLDIRAHLIDHPTLPGLLPAFEGERRSLPLNRNAPPDFRVSSVAAHNRG